MRTIRQIIACIALVVVYFLLDVPMPWGYFVPSIAATATAVLIGRVSFSFVVLMLAIIGPVMVLTTLFLISGTSWPGQAADHLFSAMSFVNFSGVLAPPFVGAATWLSLHHLAVRPSQRTRARAIRLETHQSRDRKNGGRVAHPLILPMAAHVAFTAFLYALLTIARAPKIWGIGQSPDGSNPWAAVEPRISANLSNQFEWPLFFYVACLLLIQGQTENPIAVLLAWVFIGGRLAHSYVQICTTNIRMRGLVFTVNFLAVLGLWAIVIQARAAA